ncbi:ABC transporter permease [Bacillus carboniphilus]|uniref:ABC transporter permease n=1 Tax=Bacillus carboniphilus TaxID=86663 RepID=A0ABY9JVD2_9BACI|nr:ABC transporter permease [Bacillus carboniphilus]WLR42422.1 ABC transporter permease [Bacillus carboniphilus]
MVNLIANEWIKIFKRVGTYVMIGLVLLVICAFVAGMVYFEGMQTQEEQLDWRVELQSENQMLEENAEYDDYSLEQLKINEYRLENNIPPVNETTAWTFMGENANVLSFAGLFTIIIAAGIVASEFSWGTIKVLLIRPVSRFKILLSKYITVVLFGIVITAIVFVFSGLLGLLFFGTGDSTSNVHLAYSNGEVVEQSIFLHIVKSYLFNSIDILMVMTMAFMISSAFRSSSLAIGLSIFLLIAGGNITFILSQKFDFAKYSLFANTNLTQYFNGTPLVEGMTLPFSITMLLIYFVIFQVVAFAVFMKRDVSI